jgi:hypothetical protein
MTVFELGFSFDAERETGSYYIVYSTLKEATKSGPAAAHPEAGR